jgi:cation diffusion facilitator CzcD-associated flavoprotein CzcO
MSTSLTAPFKGSPSSVPDQGALCLPLVTSPLTAPPCSGLIAYRELTEAGLDVRIFERDSVPGGNWHYTEEVPLDAPAPNAPTPTGDFVPSLPPAGVELPYSEVFENDGTIHRNHRGPKPVWESLTCNAPSVCWPMPCGS